MGGRTGKRMRKGNGASMQSQYIVDKDDIKCKRSVMGAAEDMAGWLREYVTIAQKLALTPT